MGEIKSFQSDKHLVGQRRQGGAERIFGLFLFGSDSSFLLTFQLSFNYGVEMKQKFKNGFERKKSECKG